MDKHFDFEKISKAHVLGIVKHHTKVLGDASSLRLLNDDEVEFMSLLPMYELGMISLFDVRRGCIKYFG